MMLHNLFQTPYNLKVKGFYPGRGDSGPRLVEGIVLRE